MDIQLGSGAARAANDCRPCDRLFYAALAAPLSGFFTGAWAGAALATFAPGVGGTAGLPAADGLASRSGEGIPRPEIPSPRLAPLACLPEDDPEWREQGEYAGGGMRGDKVRARSAARANQTYFGETAPARIMRRTALNLGAGGWVVHSAAGVPGPRLEHWP